MGDSYGSELMSKAEQIPSVAADVVIEFIQDAPSNQKAEMAAKYGIPLASAPGGDYLPASRAEEWRSTLETDHFGWAPARFERFSELPDPNKSAAAADLCVNIVGSDDVTYDPDSGEIDVEFEIGGGPFGSDLFSTTKTISEDLSGWESTAATFFRRNFLSKIPDKIQMQVAAVGAMRNALAANELILHQARKDAMEVVDQTLAALEEARYSCRGGNGEDIIAVLTIVAGIGTIAGSIATFPASGGTSGAGVVAGASILSGGISTFTAAKDLADGEEKQIGGGDVNDILNNMNRALIELSSKLSEGNRVLRTDAFQSLASSIQSDPMEWKAPRPTSLADADEDSIIDVVEDGA